MIQTTSSPSSRFHRRLATSMKSFSLVRAIGGPNIRQFPHQYPLRSHKVSPLSTREFHITPPRRFLDECLIQTHTIINGLHDVTGLPWAGSIPLTGLVLAALIRLPISFYVRSIIRRQNELVPELAKYGDTLQKKIIQENVDKNARYKNWLVQKKFATHCDQVWKEKGLQHWRTWLTSIRFPIWFVVMDCLRRMTGTQEGFLALIGRSLTGKHSLDQTSDDSVVHLEPSLATEGAMWFPNLSISDPSLILPFVVSASIFACSYSGFGVIRWMPTVKHSAHGFLDVARFSLWMDRMRNIMTLAVAFMTLQFPSALLLFWISNNLSVVGIGYFNLWWNRPKAAKAAVEPKSPNAKKQQYRGPTMGSLRQNNSDSPRLACSDSSGQQAPNLYPQLMKAEPPKIMLMAIRGSGQCASHSRGHDRHLVQRTRALPSNTSQS